MPSTRPQPQSLCPSHPQNKHCLLTEQPLVGFLVADSPLNQSPHICKTKLSLTMVPSGVVKPPLDCHKAFLQNCNPAFAAVSSHQQHLCVYALGSATIWLPYFLLHGLVGLRIPYLVLKPSLALPWLYSILTQWTGGFH